MRGLRLIIGDSDSRSRKKIRDVAQKQGFIIVGEARDGLTALTQIRSTQPDLVILDVQLPVMGGMEIAKIVEENRISPVVLISAFSQLEIIEQIKDSWVFAYLIKPVSEGTLIAAMELALAKYEQVSELEQEINQLKESLATRILVDKAKGILMKRLAVNEADAFRYIQKQSMKKRVAMKAIAEAIILSHDL
ncbi:MAG: ANTAR domain-containing protein [Carboxydocellales bacterium]|jgi:response regulator NasT